MNNKRDKAMIVLFIVSFIAISFGSMYFGYKFPELYMHPGVDSWRFDSNAKINIPNYCPPDPRQFPVFEDKYWCIA